MKQELLQIVSAGQEREAELELLCADGPANADGTWMPKDQLAHVVYWRARNARLLDAVRTGAELPPSVEDDQQNAVVYAENRDRGLAEIKADGVESWRALRAFVEAATEEDLLKPHPYRPENQLWETVTGDVEHLVVHLMSLYLEAGETQRAEASQVWAYRLERDVFSKPEHRAYSTYNMACFYAKSGRAEDALPLLRESLEAKPGLVSHARQDPDLDPIRDHPEVAPLLDT
jgi:tetratricopeptide (TPR) repeat protein